MYSFCPSDYLAIRTAPEILQLTFDSEGSVDYCQIFERKLSRFFGTEKVLFFPDSYLALVAILRNLIRDDDWLLIPSECDGSIPDALEIVQRLHENLRVDTLTETSWQQIPPAVTRIVILASGICESYGLVASIDYWRAKLEQIYTRYGIPSVIILDDSLGVGLLGARYRGTFEHFGCTANHTPSPNLGVQYFFSGSLSDAFGSSGGFIPGDKKWLREIKRTDPCCCSWNEIPLSSIVASTKALELVAENARHEKVTENIRILTEKLSEFKILFHSNPHLPFVLVRVANAKEVAKALEARGCRVGLTRFMRHPSLCLAVNASHQPLDIEFLVKTLAELLREKSDKK